MRFRGRLRAPEDNGPGLPVAVIINDHGLTVEADGDQVGSWSLADVSASRTSADQFAMSFGDEDMMFEAEDILSFSYEALPHIDGRRSRSGVLTKIRTAFTTPDRPAQPSSSIDLRDDRHLEVIATRPDTEAAAEVPTTNPDHCRGSRRDGQPCRSTIVLSSGFCSSHDPNRPSSRARTVPVEDRSLASVFRHLERAVSDVRAGRMEPDTAMALAELAQAMCATIDADEITRGHQTSEPAYLRRAK
jgi:hypothetical protein